MTEKRSKRRYIYAGLCAAAWAVYALVKNQNPSHVSTRQNTPAVSSTDSAASSDAAAEDLNLNYETVSPGKGSRARD